MTTTMDKKAMDVDLRPAQFADEFGINQQNVYYWIKKHGLGHKDESGFWWLTPEDQQCMLEFEAQRSPAKKYAKDPHSKNARKRATESIDSIQAKLGLDRTQAKIFSMLINYPYNETLMDLVESIYTKDEEDQSSFRHEKLLVLMGKILGRKSLGALTIKDGYPFYKFIEPANPDDFTVVYNIRAQIFYIDNVAKILERSIDLSRQKTDINIEEYSAV